MDLKQVRLAALSDVLTAIGNLETDLDAAIDPTVIATDTRRLAIDDAREAVQMLYAQTFGDTPHHV
jgi:hypothetical protein